MNINTKILIAEHSSSDIDLIHYELKKAKIEFTSHIVDNELDYKSALDEFKPDIILSDFSLPAFDGKTAFKIREDFSPEIPFIFVSGSIGEEKSIAYIKNGVTDYVLKDKLFTLGVKVIRALKESSENILKKDTEQKLIKSENLFRAIIENGTDMITLSTLEGKIIYVSPTVYKVFGYDLNEIKDKIAFDFIHPDDLKIFLEQRKAIIDIQGGSCASELRLLHAKGNWIWCESTLTNMLHLPGIHALVANFRDVSERKLMEKQREFDENNLDALINNTSDLMWSVDLNYELITFNKPFLKTINTLFGNEVTKGSTVFGGIQTNHQKAKYKLLYERAFSGEIFTEIDYNTSPVEVWSEISFSPIRKGQKVIGTACHSRDITILKKAEQQIQQSEVFNRGVLNSLSSHIAVINGVGEIVAINEAWKRFAAENGETNMNRTGIGSNYFEVCKTAVIKGEEVAGQVLQGMLDVLKENSKVFYFEYPCHSPAKERWFGMRVMKFDSEEPMVVVAHEDISLRKLAEESLLKSETRLKEAQAIGHISNWDIDLINNITTWSDELYNILGFEKEEITPNTDTFLSFIHPDDLEQTKENVRNSFETLEPSSIYFRFYKKNGELRHGYRERMFELDKNNKPVRIYGILQDVTERKIAEEEKEKLMQRMIRHNYDLEQFTFIISHNLRSPAANILGATNYLLEESLTFEEQQPFIQALSISASRLDNMIKDLNKILKVKRDSDEEKEIIHFSTIVNDIIKNLDIELDLKNIYIDTDFNIIDSIYSIKAYIHSIFYNLISNSIKYRKSGRNLKVHISSHMEKDHIILKFKDNGLGIDLAKFGDNIFGLYNRFHTHVEGKGMGLFMVKTQIESLGGKIEVKSDLEIGTEFRIELKND